ncbi:MAG TPA: nuclear transport factor 2 family protein [Candidatus Limnocylindrales bacterium]|nr:nuclear transport factor 2 family protein [Candidatus Limnocylindrales bacterium]
MTLTHEDVQTWLDRYVEAWRTYEPAAIRDLFSEDAEYRYHPWDEPVSGRDAILHDWVEPAGDASTRDTPGTYDARYEPWVVEGDRAVAVGVSSYWTDATRTQLERTFHNAFFLRFDADGRCAAFTEYFVLER